MQRLCIRIDGDRITPGVCLLTSLTESQSRAAHDTIVCKGVQAHLQIIISSNCLYTKLQFITQS